MADYSQAIVCEHGCQNSVVWFIRRKTPAGHYQFWNRKRGMWLDTKFDGPAGRARISRYRIKANAEKDAERINSITCKPDKPMNFCALTTTCSECPFLKSTPAGQFPPERFEALANTVGDGDWFRQVFACHKSPQGEEFACVGYLLVEGYSNLFVRMQASSGAFDWDKLKATGPLHKNYASMAKKNGVELP